jgi:5-methylcytosine-specific restriction endonuclease McrA
MRSLDSAENQQQQTQEWKERQAELARQRQEENDQWWAWYSDYLQSPEWAARRHKVLTRANWLCEGCRENQAVHVHHTTYTHAGNELLFELVALCQGCHQIAHPNKVI